MSALALGVFYAFCLVFASRELAGDPSAGQRFPFVFVCVSNIIGNYYLLADSDSDYHRFSRWDLVSLAFIVVTILVFTKSASGPVLYLSIAISQILNVIAMISVKLNGNRSAEQVTAERKGWVG